MGRDKAVLRLRGLTLCEHIGDVIAMVAEEVFLVGHPERYLDLKYRCLADLHPDQGPLSGLETALALQCAEFHVVVSCDSVNVKPSWLTEMLAAARRGARCVVAEDTRGIVQPLCGVYRSACSETIGRALASRRLRLMDLLADLEALTIKVDGAVLNLNTPEDYNEIVNANSRI